MVVFGGSSNGGANLGDTWEWDGAAWTMMTPASSPPMLAGAAMAFDSARGVSVLFGGSTPTAVSSDTWEWDGTSWTKRNLATSPPPMVWAAMVYDAARGRMVLFGAFNQFGVWLSETWEYDGTTWTQAHPANSPSPRRGPGMAFDSIRNKTIMFGGQDPSVGRMADTWEWDGTNWLQIATVAAPYARFWHSTAFDPVRNRTVLFGGDHIQPYSLGEDNDTWEWDGAHWTRDWTYAAPSVRAGQSMVYDSRLGRMVLFGGFNAGVTPNTLFGDTWELGTGIVTPAGSPQLTLSPTSGEFGSVDVGATSNVAAYSVLSSGTGPLVSKVSTTGDFSVSFTDCPSDPDPLAAGAACLVLVAFSPSAEGDRYGTLAFTGNMPGGSFSIALHGVGLARDFTISASPSAIGAIIGSPLPLVTVSTTTIGDVGTIALSALSNDPGISASFSPGSIASGASSTMTIAVASTVQPGNYGVAVVGTEGTTTHMADVTIQILPVPDFTIATDPAAVTVPHGTSSRIVITSTAINGVGSIGLATSVTPAGPTATLDQPYMTAGGIGFLTVGAGFGVVPGSYTVTVTGTEGANVHSTSITVAVTSKGLVNGGFESGDLTGWSQTGVDAVIKYPHTGNYSAQVGSPGSPVPFAGDSTLTQTFDVPTTGGKLVFWYRNFCGDKVKNDWFTATLRDGVTGATTTLVAPVCTKNGSWTKVTANLSSHSGNYVTVTFVDHQSTKTTNTFTLVDDVALA
ncbi:MAG TPA: choice-of-anchor D domain-containing protein [Candidatus Dormibacteraeota bacterium]|nr:choice-of-anchor D domain-containing protein [Candidatus Dormibacteraeota bacterium]